MSVWNEAGRAGLPTIQPTNQDVFITADGADPQRNGDNLPQDAKALYR